MAIHSPPINAEHHFHNKPEMAHPNNADVKILHPVNDNLRVVSLYLFLLWPITFFEWQLSLPNRLTYRNLSLPQFYLHAKLADMHFDQLQELPANQIFVQMQNRGHHYLALP